ncbi:MAG: DJ-1/PfpI family protein [Actinobacteria bacterium]|nr:DJ-1/PfpI family protein [Actinomycetota bacterium]
MQSKKVLMIIAPKNFRDEEYLRPRKILENAGASVTVASATTAEVTGMLGLKVKPDLRLTDVKVDDYDAVVFIGGGGASAYYDDQTALSIAKKAAGSKIVGAICIAPQILANAGVLQGKKATVFASQIESLKAKGANFTGAGVERDGNIITADGPGSAGEFGDAILNAITEQ